MLNLADLVGLSDAELAAKFPTPAEWAAVSAQIAQVAEVDRKETQLAYYQAKNRKARPIHLSTARQIAIAGGNRSSKTDTALAELAIQLTGHIPKSLMADYPRQKLGKPIRARVVCNSLTDTLEPVIKPKLRWDQWNGGGGPGDGRGHWGWLPRHCLLGGSWERAYSEKYRTLSIAYDAAWRDQDGQGWDRVGVSTVQFMSYDQEPSAFEGVSLHLVLHDELPPADVYRIHRMRTLDTKGQIITACTPPDEIGIARVDVGSFYEDVYERGLPGPDKDPLIDSFTLFTEDNEVLTPDEVLEVVKGMTEEQREVHLHGRFLHLSGVVYSLFTTHDSWWCFRCAKKIIPMDGGCLGCQGNDIETFAHVVEPHPVPASWPVVFVIDPHPRKKDAMGWFAITPSDDVVMIGELEADGTASDVKRAVDQKEEALGCRPILRLMDPNIATETNDKLGRGWTIRTAYDAVGLRCTLAIDDINVGIQRVNQLLMPDQRTRRPKFRVFQDCPKFIHGMKTWSWDEWTRQGDRDPKEKVRDRFKDFPDLVRYLANQQPSFLGLTRGLGVWHRPGRDG